MSKLIYLEPDEEITDVIDKISKVDNQSVSLVIPRGSTLANSIVNLKLLVKRSKSLKKDVALVTNDNIAHNLASQIGLPVFESIDEAKSSSSESKAPAETKREYQPADFSSQEEIDGVKVHQYNKEKNDQPAPEVDENTIEPEIDPNDSAEIIEAVRDVEEDVAMNENNHHKPEKEIEKAPSNFEKSDYRLEKKPLEIKPKDINHHQNLGDSGLLFDRMRTSKNRKRVIAGSIIGVLVFLLIIGAYIAFPKATVALSVVSEPYSSTADIRVSKDTESVDLASATIPGKTISEESDLTKPFSATGTKNIGESASGKITIYNNWDQNPVSLPSGSKFVSTSGVTFVSTEVVSVPGATVGLQNGQFVIISSGTKDVNVTATEPGDKGNIAPSNFTITSLSSAQQAKIYGKSSAAMSGGTNKEVKIVIEKDITDAKTSTENELKETITSKIKTGVSDSDRILDSAILTTVVSENASVKAGDQVDTFNYSVKMKIEALSFSEDDFKEVLFENAKSKLSDDKQIVSNDSESIAYEVTSADVASGAIALSGSFSGYIADKYEIEAMKSAIKFKTVKTATSKLTGYSGVLSADISLSPKFLRSLPLLTQRINIIFNYGNK